MPAKMIKQFVTFAVVCVTCSAHAQTPASVSYSPTWQARHHMQWLADEADDWRTAPADHVVTRYEEKKLGDTAPIFLEFERV